MVLPFAWNYMAVSIAQPLWVLQSRAHAVVVNLFRRARNHQRRSRTITMPSSMDSSALWVFISVPYRDTVLLPVLDAYMLTIAHFQGFDLISP
jgi:hypothetical protein